jgi:hypothetical protein
MSLWKSPYSNGNFIFERRPFQGEAVAPAAGEPAGEAVGEAAGEAVVTAGEGLAVAGLTVAVGVTVGVGVVPVGVQPVRSIAAKMTDRVSAMSFFMIVILLIK